MNIHPSLAMLKEIRAKAAKSKILLIALAPIAFTIFRHSDIITFHSYGDPEKVADLIAKLKPHGRPIINTEWLNRPGGSSVEGCLPLFAAENVGCMHWGLVNGRSQTHLRWGARPGQPEPEVWQCDLFHGDHTPYARAEIDLFKKTIATSRK